METGVPEPKQWVMLVMGFGLMAMMGFKKARLHGKRLAA